MASIGITFPPHQPPERLREVAHAAESAGLSELWLWEDCFAESGIAAASAVLGWTDRLQVGIGLLPVPLRNVALTAMELATLARLFPGRVLPGIGHGVLDWMGQVGARVDSPLTLLREYGTALQSLLAGEEVTVEGRYVSLDGVQLSWPPRELPLYIGGVGPKTVALAGEIGDGLLADSARLEASVQTVRAARERAGSDGPFEIISTVSVPVAIGPQDLAVAIGDHLLAGSTRVAVSGLDADGEPDGSDRIIDLVATTAAAAAQLV